LKKLAPELPLSLLDSPNDILGAEYCRRARIETCAVRRIRAESASSIRKRCIGEGSDMLDPARLLSLEYDHFRTLRRAPSDIAECGGGVFERLYNSAFTSSSAEEWQEMAKTKQYTNSRLRRAALFALTSVSSEELRSPVLFTSVLGANTKGREYLRSLRKDGVFPIITNHSEKKYLSDEAKKQAELSDFADSVYALCEKRSDPAFYLKSHPVITR